MNSRSRNLDYARITKQGFLLGVALFALGTVGEIGGHAVLASMPAGADQLFFGMEVTGVLLGLFVPMVFGVALPLVE